MPKGIKGFQKGNIPWDKGKKRPEISGKNNPKWKGGKQKIICHICKKSFYVNQSRKKKARYCSRKCMGQSLKGQRGHSWKGGKYRSKEGYWFVCKPSHPKSDIRGYVKHCILVMEKHLKRHLTKQELIHHKGIKYPMGSYEDRGDNKIKNLKLFPNISKHRVFHVKFQKRKNGTFC